MLRRKINYKLFDFDGCMSNNNSLETNYLEPYSENLIKNNKKFLDEEIKKISSQKYDEVIIANGSSRQSYDFDSYSRLVNTNGSFALLLPSLQRYFATKLAIPVSLDPFLLADIYAKDCQPGNSYKNILNDLRGVKTTSHPKDMTNENKISLIYAYAHRIANICKNDEIIMDFYDDRPDLLNGIFDFLRSCPELLPKNVTLQLFKHDCGRNARDRLWGCIAGTGKIDERYDWSLRLLAVKTGCFNQLSPKVFELTNIQFKLEHAAELEAFHHNSRYDDMMNLMEFPQNFFDFLDFLDMRDSKEMSPLKSNPLYTENNFFTTAEKLIEQGQIIERSEKISSLEKQSTEKEINSSSTLTTHSLFQLNEIKSTEENNRNTIERGNIPTFVLN